MHVNYPYIFEHSLELKTMENKWPAMLFLFFPSRLYIVWLISWKFSFCIKNPFCRIASGHWIIFFFCFELPVVVMSWEQTLFLALLLLFGLLEYCSFGLTAWLMSFSLIFFHFQLSKVSGGSGTSSPVPPSFDAIRPQQNEFLQVKILDNSLRFVFSC